MAKLIEVEEDGNKVSLTYQEMMWVVSRGVALQLVEDLTDMLVDEDVEEDDDG